MIKSLGEKYTPLYFLASLGNGGLAVSFYMYLNFMIKPPNVPMANYDVIFTALLKDISISSNWIAVVLLAMIYFSYNHI